MEEIFKEFPEVTFVGIITLYTLLGPKRTLFLKCETTNNFIRGPISVHS